jgi:predicted dehydrogenase
MKGAIIGAGYFSHFHMEAWGRIENVNICAVADLDIEKAKVFAKRFGISRYYNNLLDLINEEKPEFMDIATPPATHLDIIQSLIPFSIPVICQKPIAHTKEEAYKLVKLCSENGVKLMIHENFRFQPWHREIKKLLNERTIGDIHFINFRMRMGDGWQEDAYLKRQPYFRTMKRLLIYETGIHFIDLFRLLIGEIDSVYARLVKYNKDIIGEDAGVVHFNFVNGVYGVFDANRYNEDTSVNPRYTFGTCLIDGSKGSIRLYGDGKITLQKLGNKEVVHHYDHMDKNFAGDCVFATQNHFIDALQNDLPFETSGEYYLKNIDIQEAIYQSSKYKKVIQIN